MVLTKAAIINELAERNAEGTQDLLWKSLDHADRYVRWTALWILSRAKDQADRSRLVALLNKEKYRRTLWGPWAKQQLEKRHRSDFSFDLLLKLVSGGAVLKYKIFRGGIYAPFAAKHTRSADLVFYTNGHISGTINATKKNREKLSIEEWIYALTDPELLVREQAAEALSTRDSATVVRALKTLIKDPDPEIGASARLALSLHDNDGG